MSALILKMIEYRSFMLMLLKGLNDMNIRYLQNGEPTTNTTSLLWESGILAEDKGAPI